MTTQITIGQSVKRIQPGDYTDGRVGNVVEIDAEKLRARVIWHTGGPREQGARFTKPIRTWVKLAALEPDTSELKGS